MDGSQKKNFSFSGLRDVWLGQFCPAGPAEVEALEGGQRNESSVGSKPAGRNREHRKRNAISAEEAGGRTDDDLQI